MTTPLPPLAGRKIAVERAACAGERPARDPLPAAAVLYPKAQSPGGEAEASDRWRPVRDSRLPSLPMLVARRVAPTNRASATIDLMLSADHRASGRRECTTVRRPDQGKSNVPRVQVLRSHLLSWANGIVLDFANGRGLVVNELACREAEEAMDRGKTIYLLSEDRRTIVSTMRRTKAGYNERCVSSARSPRPAAPEAHAPSRPSRIRRSSTRARKPT